MNKHEQAVEERLQQTGAEETGDKEQTVEEILATLPNGEIPDTVEIVPNTRGKADFTPSTSPRRPFRTWKPLQDTYAQILCGVTSKSKGEGGTTSGHDVEKNFGLKLKPIAHRTQVTMVLPGQKMLVGYVVNTATKQSLYFPARYFPQGFNLPEAGNKAKLNVVALLVG
jgi:hypothetical protein